MLPRNDKPIDVIGWSLRKAWSDLVMAPVPEHLQLLLDQLARLEQFNGKAGKTDEIKLD